RRLAGSTVTTSTLPSIRVAAATPDDAATDVLPTPPDPQKTRISFVASSGPIDAPGLTGPAPRRAPSPPSRSHAGPATGRTGTAGRASAGPPRPATARAGSRGSAASRPRGRRRRRPTPRPARPRPPARRRWWARGDGRTSPRRDA